MNNVFAFVDAQNLNLGVKSLKWILDWKKFRQYLKDKYNVTQAFVFIGYKPGNENLYTSLQKNGFIVVLKPTMELPDGTVKGNVDAELVLHTMIHLNEYDSSIIVSGDGDFFVWRNILNKIQNFYELLLQIEATQNYINHCQNIL